MKSLCAYTLVIFSLVSTAAFADNYDVPQDGQQQDQYEVPQDGQEQMPPQQELPPEEEFEPPQPPPRQGRALPPPPAYARPGFRYHNYATPMEGTLYCNRPACVRRPPPVLPYPGPQVRMQYFPYRMRSTTCQIRPLGNGIADIVWNNRVLLYRGYGPNVQQMIWYYRKAGFCTVF